MPIFSRQFLLYAGIAVTAWLVVFGSGVLDMEAIWRRSDTFAHGYFILPLSLWLVYRDREFLMQSKVAFSWLPIPIFVGSCFVWLFGYAADINVLEQLASIVSLIAILWMLLGNELAWRYKFPLAYLIFAVPMGENLIPALQDITAWITVFLLKIHGIPVFRDGLYIQLPTGMFEVAVACSGIRYLIASMAVRTLYAYLTYASFKKQIIFIAFAFVLPIIANGIRAYLIVIIAHYSDMEYATGADHLVYGWLFFGLVIMLMFWVGGKFADPENSERSGCANFNRLFECRPLIAIGGIVSLITITLALQFRMPVVDAPETASNIFDAYPVVTDSNWGVNFSQPIKQSHIWLDDNTEAYYAHFANKQSSGELITYDNKLYNQDSWTVVERNTDDQGQYLLLRNIQGQERAILYWYQVGERRFTNPTLTKLYQALALIAGLADGATFFAVSTSITDIDDVGNQLASQAETVFRTISSKQ